MDTSTLSILVSLLPMTIILAFYLLFRNGKTRKDILFLLGFLSITAFYIFSPDPLHAYQLMEQGTYAPVFLYTVVATAFLLIAIFIFKQHRGE